MAENPSPKTIRTPGGEDLSEEDLQRFANQAGAGYELHELRPALASGASDFIAIRLDPELKASIDAQAEAGAMTPRDGRQNALRDHWRGSE